MFNKGKFSYFRPRKAASKTLYSSIKLLILVSSQILSCWNRSLLAAKHPDYQVLHKNCEFKTIAMYKFSIGLLVYAFRRGNIPIFFENKFQAISKVLFTTIYFFQEVFSLFFLSVRLTFRWDFSWKSKMPDGIFYWQLRLPVWEKKIGKVSGKRWRLWRWQFGFMQNHRIGKLSTN